MPHFLFQLSLFWPKFGPLIIGIIGKPLFILAEISMTTAVTISPVILVQTKLQTDKHRQTKITPHQLSPKRGKQVYRRRYEKPLFAATHMLTPVAYSRGGGAMMRPTPVWPWIFGYFFHCFRKLQFATEPCPKASSDCPCCLPGKNCVKMHSNLSFLDTKNDFFWGGG